MRKTRFFGLVLLSFIIALLWVSPGLAWDDPWDGTKTSDTVITSNGDLGQNPRDGSSSGGLFDLIIKWLSDKFTSKNEVSKAKLGIKQEADRSSDRQTMTIFHKHSFRR